MENYPTQTPQTPPPDNEDQKKQLKDQRVRRETIRRFTIYGLVGLVVIIFTTVIVLITEGYYFSPSKKTVIQNGLVLVDSTPNNASVVINGHEEKDRTQARFTLPQAQYAFKVWKTGYRDWTKTFGLSGSEVVDLNYILMIPNTIAHKQLAAYPGKINLFSQSPDQRWIVMHHGDSPKQLDLYDTTAKEPTPAKLVLPGAIFTDDTDFNSLQVLQWASDNTHILLSATIKNKKHFIIVSRTEPDKAVDIGVQFNIDLTTVQLHDDKWDRYYGIDTNADLREYDITLKTISAPKFQRVYGFKQYGSDKLVLASGEKDTNVIDYTLTDKYGSVVLGTTTKQDNNTYLLDISQYDGDFYVVAGSQLEHQVVLYKNTFDLIKSHTTTQPKALAKIDVSAPTDTTFSKSSKFVAIKSGNEYVVYDNELNLTYRFTLPGSIDESAKTADWADANHLLLRSDKHQFIVDYDGLNRQDLGTASDLAPVALSKSSEQFYSIDATSDTSQLFMRSNLNNDVSN